MTQKVRTLIALFWSRHLQRRPGGRNKKAGCKKAASSVGLTVVGSYPGDKYFSEALLPTFLCSASCEVLSHAVIHLNQALHDPVSPTHRSVLLMLLQDGNKFVCEALQSLSDCFDSTGRVVGRRVTIGED